MKPKNLASLLFLILLALFCWLVAGCAVTFERGADGSTRVHTEVTDGKAALRAVRSL